jgi:hypothetical protein
MSDSAGIAPGDPDFDERRAGEIPEDAPRVGPGLSRRRFLRVAVAGGVTIGVASPGRVRTGR